MNRLNPHLFKHADEIGHWQLAYSSSLLLHRGNGDRHVPVTRERDVPRQRSESIAACVSERFAEGIFGGAAIEQKENAQALLGVGWGIEPGHPTSATVRTLTYAKAEWQL